LVDKIQVNFQQEVSDIIPEDKWNSWVFSLRGSMFMRAESSYSSMNITSSVSADRITDKWKIQFEGHKFFFAIHIHH